MAEITPAVGWVVSPVIKIVTDKIKSFIEEKYFEKSSIEDDMKEMNTCLLEILSIMAIVEKHRIVDPFRVQAKSEQQIIKDAVYDAEDCLIEFDYKLAVEESEKLLPNKVRRVGASCSRVIHQAIVGNFNLKKQLRKVNESLNRACGSARVLLKMHRLDKIKMKLPKQENQFITSFLIGREKERELMIEWILEEKTGPPSIIPIVGQGGSGKTILAQMIFNDPILNSHFESNQKIWITVSDNFDKLELTEQMLKYLCENFSTSNATFKKLQRKLEAELASKKILLVLDDVWYVKDNNNKYSYEKDWLEFLAPLRNANTGSTIIVTTRENLVVDTYKSLGSIMPISLDALNDDDGWSLLKLNAFDSGNPDNLHDLEPIGRKIVNMLKGLPLAISVMGQRLRGKFDIQEWERILNNNSLDNVVMKVLHRSYEHLPAHLQRCFAYCSLFPKDYYLKRDRLVHMWIAHGFVLPQLGERLEDVGKSYFSELIARSFIQVIKRNNKEYYVMHDLMNDLACHVSKGECYILKEHDTLEKLGSVRHLSVTTRELAHLVKVPDLDKLHTFILLSDSSEVDVADEVFNKMKRIRVLDIDCRLGKLPNIGECRFLHYLCFRHCKSELASDTFSKLHLLTVLFIRNGHTCKEEVLDFWPTLKLPQSTCSMSRLEFIDTSKSIKMELGGQGQLHSVWRGGPATFYVKKKEGWDLGHLRDFNNIKGSLEIGGLQNVASREKAIEAQLDSKDHVTELRLKWDWKSGVVENNIEHIEVLEALRPHPNIESLEILQYPGYKFPSWLKPNRHSRMTRIYIGGPNFGFKMLPTLGQFSQLKEVKIIDIHVVSRIGDEFYGNGIFPSLQLLHISKMKGLEVWESPPGVNSFPKLRTLQLCECPNLFSLPEMESFCSLESVEIVNCLKVKLLPKLPASLQCLKVSGAHPDLEEQLGNKNGPEWDKFAAVSGCHCTIYRSGTWEVVQDGRRSEANEEDFMPSSSE